MTYTPTSPEQRAWQAAEDVPPVPEAVQLRLAGVWREAVAAARGEHEAAR